MRAVSISRKAIVATMHLTILPDWNSLDSVRSAHSNLELAGIVGFALLVIMEVLAHNSKDEGKKHRFDSIGIWFFAIAVICELAAYWYGQRNDDLSAEKITSLDTKAGDAFKKASDAYGLANSASAVATPAKETADAAKREADAVSKDLVVTKKKAADSEARLADETQRTVRLEAQLSWRTVTPEQKSSLRKLLLSSRPQGLKGLTITITFDNNDTEGQEYARELREALDGLGTGIPEPQGQILFLSPTEGVVVMANRDRNPDSIFFLNALKVLDTPIAGVKNDGLDEHTFEIFVRTKPRN